MAGRLLLHVFPSFAIGGSQVRFARLARLLGDKYRHLIVALDGVHDARALLDAGVDYRIHHLPGAGKRADKRICAANPVVNLVADLVATRAELRALRPDLLVTYNWGAIEWGLANRLAAPSGAIWRPPGCPQVHIEDGFGPEEAVSAPSLPGFRSPPFRSTASSAACWVRSRTSFSPSSSPRWAR